MICQLCVFVVMSVILRGADGLECGTEPVQDCGWMFNETACAKGYVPLLQEPGTGKSCMWYTIFDPPTCVENTDCAIKTPPPGPTPAPTPEPTPPPVPPPPPTPPKPACNTCQAGQTCCNPQSKPPEICPGNIACCDCGKTACQCPSSVYNPFLLRGASVDSRL
eukprot:TRINITY_DN5439_c0_g1_i1.p1 TRINITY_DN5439_c0_g1~~TRINITY_DN5439_c0_g1_i1.p1  ORF type:complete len:164 (+),score=11.72 TRINITY_DN5439_c0_g1_i1:43-534(+)